MLTKDLYQLIRRLRETSLGLLFPLLLQLFALFFIITQIPFIGHNVWLVFNSIIVTLSPGFYLAVTLRRRMDLSLVETTILDIVMSFALIMFSTIVASFLFTEVGPTQIGIVLFCITLDSMLSLAFGKSSNTSQFQNSKSIQFTHWVLDATIAIGIFLIGFVLELYAIPVSFWIGYDPWLNSPVANAIILQGLNPLKINSIYGVLNVSISGFYYFIAGVHSFTDISLYTITRYGGPILVGLIGLLTFFTLRRFTNVVAASVASSLLFINPFFQHRFAMSLRENFAFVFLLAIIFLLVLIEQRGASKKFEFFEISIIGLFLGTTLSAQELVPVIAYPIIILFMLKYARGRHAFLTWVSGILFSLLVAAPYLGMNAYVLTWVWSNWVPHSLESITPTLVLPAVGIILGTSVLRSGKITLSANNRNKIVWVAVLVLLFGAMYAIIAPANTNFAYNPQITPSMFGYENLILGILGFIVVPLVKYKPPLTIGFFGIVLILIADATLSGFSFPLFRLAIYITWILSAGLAISIKFIFESLRGV